MITIENNSTDPYFNLALEEYILKNLDLNDDIFLLWQNEPSLIVGRNQNIFEEINLNLAISKGIPFIRRISGGGTVYHDLGNLNYTYITKSKGNINNYELMTKNIIKAFNNINIPVELVGKSDLKINQLKISGNAQFVYKDLLLHHGTLLYKTDLSLLNGLLRPKKEDVDSVSVKSNRSSVTNISDYTEFSLTELKNYLYEFILGSDYKNKMLHLSDTVIEQINLLKNDKYLTWEWNYAESPRCVLKKIHDTYRTEIKIEHGIMTEVKVFNNEIEDTELERLLLNKKFIPGELKSILKNHLEVYDCLFS
ncbi:Lipoate-protein ligase A [Alteracholeplasma palmae J233]|uniref:Lipoate-protein ligase A n=1 Tax=Alteracholeplasma palmae (strain ATCC 49389 / J233) TaxID=1318466 RepID=U4KJV7_ALTPJ|nr:lipoate--protein ligase [Alteracholeplasma palmae]CCV63738.1 Lipoate-protein ligase A [Alteracholeplasma palmae J233]